MGNIDGMKEIGIIGRLRELVFMFFQFVDSLINVRLKFRI